MEKEIEIRSLNGESITVSIAGHGSISDLKALLKGSFLPAKNYPNFHLFFKVGVQCLISTLSSLDQNFIYFEG